MSVNNLSLSPVPVLPPVPGDDGVQVNTKSLVVVAAASDIGWRVTLVSNAASAPKSAFKDRVLGNAVAWQ